MQITPETVRALRDKYRALARMRAADAAGAAQDPRAEMAALARRFPGALRELDELPPELLQARLDALEAIVERGAPAPEWVRLQIAYHGFMRVTLRIKRALSTTAHADRDAALRALHEQSAALPDEPALSSFDERALAAIAAPEGGRLNPWVFQQVALACAVSAEDVRKALFLR